MVHKTFKTAHLDRLDLHGKRHSILRLKRRQSLKTKTSAPRRHATCDLRCLSLTFPFPSLLQFHSRFDALPSHFLLICHVGVAVGGILPNCGDERKNGRYQIVTFNDNLEMSRSDKDAVIHGNNNAEQQVRRLIGLHGTGRKHYSSTMAFTGSSLC